MLSMTLEFSREDREILKRYFPSKLSRNRLLRVTFYGNLSNKGEALKQNHTHSSLFRDNLFAKISF